MALRTPRIFAALSHPDRFRVFLAILQAADEPGRQQGMTQAQALSELLDLAQTTVSRCCGQLFDVDLLVRDGNTRAPFAVARPQESRAMIRAAALVEASAADSTGDEAHELAREMLRQDMLRGADEARLGQRPDSLRQP